MKRALPYVLAFLGLWATIWLVPLALWCFVLWRLPEWGTAIRVWIVVSLIVSAAIARGTPDASSRRPRR